MPLHRVRMSRSLSESDIGKVCDNVVSIDDVDERCLAALMLSAYRGTVDDEGETLDAAIQELRSVRNGAYGPVITAASGVIIREGEPVSAIITTEYGLKPLICYVFTNPAVQRHGLAAMLIQRACAALAAEGWTNVELAVTIGSAGERLYRRLGFTQIRDAD